MNTTSWRWHFWVWCVRRNRFSVHGVVPLAFPGLLTLTSWPLKRGGYDFVTDYFCNLQGHRNNWWRKLWRQRNVMHCQSTGATVNRSQVLGHTSPVPVLSQKLETANLTCIPQAKADNMGSSCVNVSSRSEFQIPEVEESAGRHVGLSPEQSTGEQFYVPWPFPQKWTRVHFWKSGSKGKDISWQWTEFNVPICFSKKQNAILASSWASFTLSSFPTESLSELISCLYRVKPLGWLNS